MKKLTILLFAGMALYSCSSPAAKEEKKPEMPATKEKTDKYAGLQFASQKDTSCGMPLSSGVGDTLMLEGKIYGFCSTECKEAFAKVLHDEHKR